MQKVHDQFHEQGVTVLTISIDGRGERAVTPFMTAHGYTFLSLIDRRMEVARLFGMRLVPTTYVLNRDGHIVGAGYGPIDLAGQAFTEFVRGVLGAS